MKETSSMADDNVQHGIDDNPSGDPGKGAVLGGIGGAVVGALAGGPVGAVVGAVAGAVASGAGVAAVDSGSDMSNNENNYSNTTNTTDADTMRVPVVEETVSVNKDVHQAGEVAVSKHVVEEQVNVPVQVVHEEVTVTRHAADRPLQPGEQVLGDDEVIRVPVMEETVNVNKQAHVAEEIEIRKHAVTEQQNVQETVRREVVDVDDSTGRSSGGTV
jgi:uncharacterized protein (TIGR02271 family)